MERLGGRRERFLHCLACCQPDAAGVIAHQLVAMKEASRTLIQLLDGVSDHAKGNSGQEHPLYNLLSNWLQSVT